MKCKVLFTWYNRKGSCKLFKSLKQHLETYSFCSVSYYYNLFSSPGPKVQVNYCPHLASVVWRLSYVNFSHFKLLLRNHWADWNQT